MPKPTCSHLWKEYRRLCHCCSSLIGLNYCYCCKRQKKENISKCGQMDWFKNSKKLLQFSYLTLMPEIDQNTVHDKYNPLVLIQTVFSTMRSIQYTDTFLPFPNEIPELWYFLLKVDSKKSIMVKTEGAHE